MRGKRKSKPREIRPDPKYNSVVLETFINYVMKDGKKSVARKVVYEALELIEKKTKLPPMQVFAKALKEVSPSVEVRTRRIGGANYQVPVPVSSNRKKFLAMKWIIQASAKKKGRPMSERLAEELIAAYNSEGEAVKIKENTHRMAETNKAFAYLAWQ